MNSSSINDADATPQTESCLDSESELMTTPTGDQSLKVVKNVKKVVTLDATQEGRKNFIYFLRMVSPDDSEIENNTYFLVDGKYLSKKYKNSICSGVSVSIRSLKLVEYRHQPPPAPLWLTRFLDDLECGLTLSVGTYSFRLYEQARGLVTPLTIEQTIPRKDVLDQILRIEPRNDKNNANPFLRLDRVDVAKLACIQEGTYTLSRTSPHGRLYVNRKGFYYHSIQDCYRPMRLLLLDDQYYELDISSCHFRIALGVVVNHIQHARPNLNYEQALTLVSDDDITEFPRLELMCQYVADKTMILDTLCRHYEADKGVIKEILLSFLYGSTINRLYYYKRDKKITFDHHSDLLLDFKQECDQLKYWMEKNKSTLYTNIEKRCKAKKNDLDLDDCEYIDTDADPLKSTYKKSASAVFFQDIEGTIGFLATEYLKSRKFDVTMLIHDGIAVKKDDRLTADVVDDIVAFIYRNTNIKVEMKLKAYTKPEGLDQHFEDSLQYNPIKLVETIDMVPETLYERMLDMILPETLDTATTYKYLVIAVACVPSQVRPAFFIHKVCKTSGRGLSPELVYSDMERILKLTKLTESDNEGALQTIKTQCRKGQPKVFDEKFKDKIREIMDAYTAEVYPTLEAFQKRYATDKELFVIDERYFSKGVTDKMLEAKVVVGQSSTGSGKSTEAEMIAEKARSKGQSIGLISIRKTHRTFLSKKFKVPAYDSSRPDDYTSAVIELESIDHFKDSRFDLFIIDEIQSILNAVRSETMKYNHGDKFNTLFNLILRSNQTLLLDACLSWSVISLIQTLKVELTTPTIPNPISIIYNKKIALDRDVVMVDTKTQMFELIYESLDKDRHIIIPCSTKTEVETLETDLKARYPNKKIKAYTRTRGDKKDFFNVKDEWKVDVVLYSSCVTVAVDFSDKWFDDCFAFVTPLGPTAYEILQMLFRARELSSKIIYMFVGSRVFVKSSTRIATNIAGQRANLERQAYKLANLSSHTLRQTTDARIAKVPWMLTAAAQVDVERHLFRMFPEHMIIRTLEQFGITSIKNYGQPTITNIDDEVPTPTITDQPPDIDQPLTYDQIDMSSFDVRLIPNYRKDIFFPPVGTSEEKLKQYTPSYVDQQTKKYFFTKKFVDKVTKGVKGKINIDLEDLKHKTISTLYDQIYVEHKNANMTEQKINFNRIMLCDDPLRVSIMSFMPYQRLKNGETLKEGEVGITSSHDEVHYKQVYEKLFNPEGKQVGVASRTKYEAVEGKRVYKVTEKVIDTTIQSSHIPLFVRSLVDISKKLGGIDLLHPARLKKEILESADTTRFIVSLVRQHSLRIKLDNKPVTTRKLIDILNNFMNNSLGGHFAISHDKTGKKGKQERPYIDYTPFIENGYALFKPFTLHRMNGDE